MWWGCWGGQQAETSTPTADQPLARNHEAGRGTEARPREGARAKALRASAQGHTSPKGRLTIIRETGQASEEETEGPGGHPVGL